LLTSLTPDLIRDYRVWYTLHQTFLTYTDRIYDLALIFICIAPDSGLSNIVISFVEVEAQATVRFRPPRVLYYNVNWKPLIIVE
jgi:hypothetical protein